MTPHDIAQLGYAIAFVSATWAAFLFGLKWLEMKARQSVEQARMDKLEADLAAHKATHKAAIENLVSEMRNEIGAIKTKASVVADKVRNMPPRFGR